MLNINNVYELTADEESYVNSTLLPQIAAGKDPWDDKKKMTVKIKEKIRKKLIEEQENRCVFCEMALARHGKHLEHYVARNIIMNFVYETRNLFLSCPSCNSRAVKDDKGIITEPGNKSVYEMNTFLVVHPYFHNPDDHLKYTDQRRVIFDKNKCSSIGLNTISIFKWEEKDAIIDRAEAYKSRKYKKEIQDIVNEALMYPSLKTKI